MILQSTDIHRVTLRIGEIFNMTTAAVSMAAVGFAKEIDVNKELKAAVNRIDCSFRV